jgi:hypothetical protein
MMSSNVINSSTNSLEMIFALPCTPDVLMAYNRKQQVTAHWTQEQSDENLDRQARNCAGLVYDAEHNRFIDLHGNIYRSPNQLDSLMILVTIRRRYSYDFQELKISDIERHIFLVDKEDLRLNPAYVRVDERNDVRTSLILVAMFHFGEEHPYFPKNDGGNLRLMVTVFGDPVSLPLELGTPAVEY